MLRRMTYTGALDFEPGSRRSRAPIPSILDLPLQLLIDIFSRIPIKSILYSRCVCKLWYNILSDVEFTNLYPSQIPISLLLQAPNFRSALHPNPLSKILYLMDVQRTNAYPGLIFNPRTSLQNIDYTCSRLVLKPKTNLPDIDFGLVNSCDGLLCLYDFKTYDPVYVCNPILGQFITLPRAESATCTGSVTCLGFGFSRRSKQYKVMRIVQRVSFTLPQKLIHMVEIYTLGGEGAWRSLGESKYFPARLNFNAFVKGILHWDSYFGDTYFFFDFDSEQFGLISGPEIIGSVHKGNSRLGALQDRLSVCYYNNAPQVEIWLMNDYGVKESWAKEFVISLVGIPIMGMENPISCEPIKLLDSGDILMLLGKCALVLYDAKLKCVRVQYHCVPTFEAISYTPTFLSLKKVAKGEHIFRTGLR